MDTVALLKLKPEELANSLLQRRLMLKESLPGVIRNLEAEEESLSPKVERLARSFEDANSKVAELKKARDSGQSEAGVLISEVKEIREDLIESGGMVNLDPKWKKEKMLEKIEEIEHKIQTSALDHRSERKLLDERRALISQNDKWLKDRKDSNPEMSEYLKKSRKMSSLYKKADKAHAKMLDAVEKAQPIYEKTTAATEELREIRSQLDRARELLSQSDRAIGHWERRLKDGFGDIGPGFPDLLRGHEIVKGGGLSSFAKAPASNSNPKKKSVREEE
tara:strand:+ start:252 stop:1085 length:834 start_codon:yes stop_codon:yes gene_type:complete